MIVAFVPLLFLGLVFVGFVLIVMLLREIGKQQQQNLRYARRKTLSYARRSNRLINDSPLRHRLILLAGNPSTAQRLYQDIKRKNPFATEEWCLEKAIYDLERDRI